MPTELNALEIKLELTRRGVSNKSVAEQLDLSNAAVSKALHGQLPTVLRHIYNLLYPHQGSGVEHEPTTMP